MKNEFMVNKVDSNSRGRKYSTGRNTSRGKLFGEAKSREKMLEIQQNQHRKGIRTVAIKENNPIGD